MWICTGMCNLCMLLILTSHNYLHWGMKNRQLPRPSSSSTHFLLWILYLHGVNFISENVLYSFRKIAEALPSIKKCIDNVEQNMSLFHSDNISNSFEWKNIKNIYGEISMSLLTFAIFWNSVIWWNSYIKYEVRDEYYHGGGHWSLQGHPGEGDGTQQVSDHSAPVPYIFT